ncbi:hypothetical protein [Spirosoma agri]|jgi:chromosome segregation ATPase|uniref:Uncharacterized protein n=1 Tax=Spirosoma agri TaxID=1987381 RepID=A0A6M0IMF6_9BACT|nr:hypothetical protein [Spirosoma agri]NEU69496.1 hypothetical protein [Spirosoma agri]
MKKIDNQSLLGCIESCFMLSMDDRLTLKQQKKMNALGKQLRGNLLNLLTAQFNDDVKQVDSANQQLQQLNTQLADTQAAIARLNDTIATAASVVKALDKLLLLAVSFI